MSPTKSGKQLQLTIRLDADTFARVEAVAAKLSRPGLAVTPTDVLRMAVAEGLPALEKRRS